MHERDHSANRNRARSSETMDLRSRSRQDSTRTADNSANSAGREPRASTSNDRTNHQRVSALRATHAYNQGNADLSRVEPSGTMPISAYGGCERARVATHIARSDCSHPSREIVAPTTLTISGRNDARTSLAACAIRHGAPLEPKMSLQSMVLSSHSCSRLEN